MARGFQPATYAPGTFVLSTRLTAAQLTLLRASLATAAARGIDPPDEAFAVETHAGINQPGPVRDARQAIRWATAVAASAL